MFNCKESEVLGKSLVTKNSENVEKEGAPENAIDKLNLDCLVKILTYIPPKERLEMEKVSQNWKEAVESSWYSVKKFVSFSKYFRQEYEESKILENCCQYLTHLTLNNGLSSEVYEIIKNKCKNIICFKIYTEHNETHEKICHIITSMSKLKYLKVVILTDAATDPFTRLFHRLPSNMQEISISAISSTGRNTYVQLELPDNLSNLRRLEVRRFILTNSVIESKLSIRKTLVHLDLSECKFPTDSSSMFSNFNNLEYLKLSSVINLDVNAIIHIAHNCQKLKHFTFRSINNDNGEVKYIPYRVFRELKYLNNLQHLDISNVIESTAGDDESFISCIGNNSKLKYLNIDTGLFTNPSNIDFKEIKKLKKLKYLRCTAEINSQQLIDISSNCSELRTFSTTLFKKNISRVALEKLANLEMLEELIFFNQDNLTDDVLIKIVSSCKNLVILHLCLCTNIRGEAFLHFGKLKYLKKLVINRMANVPNATFNNLYNLHTLSCFDCPSLTDEDITKVINNCQQLCYLNLSKTGVTNKFLFHKPANPRLAHGKLYIRVDESLKSHYSNNSAEISHYDIFYI